MAERAKDTSVADKLRKALHERIDRLPAARLQAADYLLLQMEADSAGAELDFDFNQGQKESKPEDTKKRPTRDGESRP